MQYNLNLRQLLVGLMFENGEPSWTRFLSFLFVIVFLGVTIYLVVTGKSWTHYSEFSTLTAGGGAVTQIANKFIREKYSTPAGASAPKNTTTHPDDE